MRRFIISIVILAMVAGSAVANIDDIINRNSTAMVQEETFCGNWHNAVIFFESRRSAEVTFGQLIQYFRDSSYAFVSSGLTAFATPIPPPSKWFYTFSRYLCYNRPRVATYNIIWTLYENDSYDQVNISLRTPVGDGSEIIRSATIISR